jgi:hypothetical protein
LNKESTIHFGFPMRKRVSSAFFIYGQPGEPWKKEIRSCTRVKAMTGVGPSIHPALDKGLSGPSGTKLERRPVPLGR